MISTLYRGKTTRIINVNPFHDDTTADEKYQFTCSVVFSATEPSWKGLIPSVSTNYILIHCPSDCSCYTRYHFACCNYFKNDIKACHFRIKYQECVKDLLVVT